MGKGKAYREISIPRTNTSSTQTLVRNQQNSEHNIHKRTRENNVRGVVSTQRVEGQAKEIQSQYIQTVNAGKDDVNMSDTYVKETLYKVGPDTVACMNPL